MKKFPMIAGLDAYLNRKKNPSMRDYADRYAEWRTGSMLTKEPQPVGLNDIAPKAIRNDIDEIVMSGRAGKAPLAGRLAAFTLRTELTVTVLAQSPEDGLERLRQMMVDLESSGKLSGFISIS